MRCDRAYLIRSQVTPRGERHPHRRCAISPVSAIVLEIDGAYVATCGECPWTRAFQSELIAGRRAFAHEKTHLDWDGTMALLRRLAERRERTPMDDHQHSWHCTFEVCSTGPTRAQLVAATKSRRR